MESEGPSKPLKGEAAEIIRARCGGDLDSVVLGPPTAPAELASQMEILRAD